MNDEERIISPDDVFNQQIQDQEEISPYVNEPVREKLNVSDLTKGLKNFLNPERPDEETLEKRRKEFQFKKDLIGGDSNFLAGPASPLFNFILKENRKYVSAYSNLGYIKLLQGKESDALLLYKKGESIDPDNELLLLNLSAYYLYKHENKIAKKYLQHLHKLYPKNEKVIVALNKL